LFHLLTPVSFDTVRKAYQSCLENRRRESPQTLAALLLRLWEIPGEPDEPKPLWRFVSILIQDLASEPDRQEALRDWAQAQGLPLPPGVSTSVLTPSKNLEICLMVKVQPRSLNDPSLGYLISAAIIKDPDPWEIEVNRIDIGLDV
jgi:vWA-MoxR associated protein middle region (VMAP-M) 1/vWA-MoxR associated protein middle region 0